MVLIKVDTDLISEHEKRHRARIFDDILDTLNKHGTVTMKKVDDIPEISDEGDLEHWPFKVLDPGKKAKFDPYDLMKFCETITKHINEDEAFAEWMMEVIEMQLQHMFLDKVICCKHVQILREINPGWVEKQIQMRAENSHD